MSWLYQVCEKIVWVRWSLKVSLSTTFQVNQQCHFPFSLNKWKINQYLSKSWNRHWYCILQLLCRLSKLQFEQICRECTRYCWHVGYSYQACEKIVWVRWSLKVSLSITFQVNQSTCLKYCDICLKVQIRMVRQTMWMLQGLFVNRSSSVHLAFQKVFC